MTKLFLSSLEQSGRFNLIPDDVIYSCKYVLFSYFYLQKVIKDRHLSQILKHFNDRDRLLVDSGAFSFMNGHQVSEKKLDEYCEEYVAFINKYNIKRFVEMDIDAIFGYDKALEYRKYIEDNTQRQSIPIFHRTRGKHEFEIMVRDYEYCGLGGIAIKTISKDEYRYFHQLNEYARYYGSHMHAMGFTPTRNLNSYGFYSSDSSSWSSGTRFGTLYQYLGNKRIKAVKKMGYRISATPAKIHTHNYIEWTKYQKAVDRR